MKEAIQKTVEGFLPELWAMSREMYENPEPGLEEINSSRLLREWLTKQGFAFFEEKFDFPYPPPSGRCTAPESRCWAFCASTTLCPR